MEVLYNMCIAGRDGDKASEFASDNLKLCLLSLRIKE